MLSMQKIAFIVGMTIGVTLFALFLYLALPDMIQNNHWGQIDVFKISDEKLLAKFQASPAYIAFYERYPDAKEELNNNRYRGELQVGVANIEKANFLELNLSYNNYDDQITANISCETSNNRENIRANGLFVIDFISQTDCLNRESDRDMD